MLSNSEPLTRMTVHIHYLKDDEIVGHDVIEGEVPMTQQQQDAYKTMIGDGKAEVTASREISEADYGRGGKCFVSIKLTVDQSQAGLEAGEAWAKAFVTQKVWESHEEMRNQLVQRGVIKP